MADSMVVVVVGGFGYRLSPVPFLNSFVKKKIVFVVTFNDIGCFYRYKPA